MGTGDFVAARVQLASTSVPCAGGRAVRAVCPFKVAPGMWEDFNQCSAHRGRSIRYANQRSYLNKQPQEQPHPS